MGHHHPGPNKIASVMTPSAGRLKDVPAPPPPPGRTSIYSEREQVYKFIIVEALDPSAAADYYQVFDKLDIRYIDKSFYSYCKIVTENVGDFHSEVVS